MSVNLSLANGKLCEYAAKATSANFIAAIPSKRTG